MLKILLLTYSVMYSLSSYADSASTDLIREAKNGTVYRLMGHQAGCVSGYALQYKGMMSKDGTRSKHDVLIGLNSLDSSWEDFDISIRKKTPAGAANVIYQTTRSASVTDGVSPTTSITLPGVGHENITQFDDASKFYQTYSAWSASVGYGIESYKYTVSFDPQKQIITYNRAWNSPNISCKYLRAR